MSAYTDFVSIFFKQSNVFYLSHCYFYLYVCISHSCVQLFTTPWIVACQAPLAMDFSRQEYWSGLPFPSPVFTFKL